LCGSIRRRAESSRGLLLMVGADAGGCIQSKLSAPAFHQPWRMSQGLSNLRSRSRWLGVCECVAAFELLEIVTCRQFAQHGIDESDGRTFARALYQLRAFVHGGAGGNSLQPSQLVGRYTKHSEDFEIESLERSRRSCFEGRAE